MRVRQHALPKLLRSEGGAYARRAIAKVESQIIQLPSSRISVFGFSFWADPRRNAKLLARHLARFVVYNVSVGGMSAIAVIAVGSSALYPPAASEFGFGGPSLVTEDSGGTVDVAGTKGMGDSSLLYAHAQSPWATSDDTEDGIGGSVPDPTLASVQESTLFATLSPLTTATSQNNRTDIASYTVQEGDTPSAIAASFGITLNTLLWANSLSATSTIRIGQELVILPVSGVRHKVKDGDTVSSIARLYKGDVDDVIVSNNLPPDAEIRAGQYVLVPDGEMPRPTYRPSVAASSSYSSSRSGPDLGGYFIRPTSGRISQGLHPTNAVDIASACWTPIYAAAAGSVVVADNYGWNGGYGYFTRIQHPNGTATVYAHAIKLAVSVGEQVAQGQLIAHMGSTGRSTGCHLHFEVWGARNPLR